MLALLNICKNINCQEECPRVKRSGSTQCCMQSHTMTLPTHPRSGNWHSLKGSLKKKCYTCSPPIHWASFKVYIENDAAVLSCLDIGGNNKVLDKNIIKHAPLQYFLSLHLRRNNNYRKPTSQIVKNVKDEGHFKPSQHQHQIKQSRC